MMRSQKTIKTGEIITRNYGLILSGPGQRTFLAPLNYLLGSLIVASPEAINEQLDKKARREGRSGANLKRGFMNGIERRSKGDVLYMIGEGEAVKNVKRYGQFTGEVIAKSENDRIFEQPGTHKVSLSYGEEPFSYNQAGCDCDDNFWSNIKSPSVTNFCAHLAALEYALLKDQRSRASKIDSITGLYPAERKANIVQPFRFTLDGILGNGMDILFEYFANGTNQYAINKAILEDPSYYSPELMSFIEENPERISRTVVPLRERTKKVWENETRTYGHAKALENRIVSELESKGFRKAGMGLEFQGTPHEVVAKRYQRGDTVYEICANEETLPIIVRKHLGESSDWFDDRDTRTDSPFARTETYESIDDTTRRECVNKISVPSVDESRLFVPVHLERGYKKAVNEARAA